MPEILLGHWSVQMTSTGKEERWMIPAASDSLKYVSMAFPFGPDREYRWSLGGDVPDISSMAQLYGRWGGKDLALALLNTSWKIMVPWQKCVLSGVQPGSSHSGGPWFWSQLTLAFSVENIQGWRLKIIEHDVKKGLQRSGFPSYRSWVPTSGIVQGCTEGEWRLEPHEKRNQHTWTSHNSKSFIK